MFSTMRGNVYREPGAVAPLPRLAPVVVVLSLVLLAVVPVVFQVRIRTLRNGISDVAAPALIQVSSLQLALVTKVLEAGGFALTWDPLYAGLFQGSVRRQNEILAELLPLARRLPPPIPARADEVSRILNEADPVLDDLIGGRISLEAYVEQFLAEQATYSRTTTALGLLNQAISDFVAAQTESIRRLERIRIVATSALVILALVSVGVVGLLVRERTWAHAERERLLKAEHRARGASDEARAVANQRRQELERVTESRAGLIRGFSHDVKNPLSAADGYLELLETGLKGPLTKEQSESVGSARHSVATALGLIKDLIELARADEVELERAVVDLRTIVSELVQENRALAEAKGLHLAAELPEDSQPIRTDARRVHQIVGNLIANAIKYTRLGKITVQVTTPQRRHGARDGSWNVVRVCDTGEGIAADQRRFLFREFHRLETSKGTEGHGIGLAISRRLARALGGDLTVETQVGRGSRFELWLPADLPTGYARARTAM